jgi:hypothetical protein
MIPRLLEGWYTTDGKKIRRLAVGGTLISVLSQAAVPAAARHFCTTAVTVK